MFHPAAQTPPMWLSEACAALAFALFAGCMILLCVGLS